MDDLGSKAIYVCLQIVNLPYFYRTKLEKNDLSGVLPPQSHLGFWSRLRGYAGCSVKAGLDGLIKGRLVMDNAENEGTVLVRDYTKEQGELFDIATCGQQLALHLGRK